MKKKKKKLFIVSDIHGCYDEFIEGLAGAGYDEYNNSHLLISVGDAFDRGEQSLVIYEYLKRLSDENKAIILMGNHDLMFIDYLIGNDTSPFNYIRNGENTTFAEFLHQTKPFETWCAINDNATPTYNDFKNWITSAVKEINEEYPELLPWLQKRPFYYETKNYIFTHGAIDIMAEDWHKPYTKWEYLTWDNGSFFESEIENTDKTVVIGHFGTGHLRKLHNLGDENDFSILKREDGRVIAVDGTVVLSRKVNVLVLEDELL